MAHDVTAPHFPHSSLEFTGLLEVRATNRQDIDIFSPLRHFGSSVDISSNEIFQLISKNLPPWKPLSLELEISCNIVCPPDTQGILFNVR